MHPLVGKALLRVVLFFTYGFFVAWIFTLIERTDDSGYIRMNRTLSELKKEIDLKHNMTDKEFESFTRRAAAAVTEGEELEWTFLNSLGFVLAALTTIGYGHITPKTQLGQGFTIITCIVGIPITMLALKSAGELLATCITFLVLKTETVLLKKDEPKHVKKKTIFWACTLMVVLLILTSVSTMFLESWSFVEGLYAWFITFTTIGFGDYVQFVSNARKVARGEMTNTELYIKVLCFAVPYVIGLSLMSCILSCLVDSIDHIRNFRDRYLNWCPSFISLIKRLLCRKSSSYDLSEEQNQVEGNELTYM